MALVDTIWNGHYHAAICIGDLFDVCHHKGCLRRRVFKTVLFRFMHNFINYFWRLDWIKFVLRLQFWYKDNHWILSGKIQNNKDWKHILLIAFLVSMWVAIIVQCVTGSDVLRWRSFYASHDIAWRAHYREVFDHGIREVLCCLGRVKYSYVLIWSTFLCPYIISV
jgi:hypothetical protein